MEVGGGTWSETTMPIATFKSQIEIQWMKACMHACSLYDSNKCTKKPVGLATLWNNAIFHVHALDVPSLDPVHCYNAGIQWYKEL